MSFAFIQFDKIFSVLRSSCRLLVCVVVFFPWSPDVGFFCCLLGKLVVYEREVERSNRNSIVVRVAA